MNTQPILEQLLEIKKIQSITSVLHWDQETYMPDGAGDIRAEHIAYLSSLSHHLHTGEKFKSELEKLVDIKTGAPLDPQVNLETRRLLFLAWKDYHDSAALPSDFVQEVSLHSAKSQQIWQKARQENDYDTFAPYLEKTVRLKKQEAEYYGYTTTPYDSLFDKYEPDMTSEKIVSLFNELKTPLIRLVKNIKNSPSKIDDKPMYRSFDVDKQWNFGMKIVEAMGFDSSKGRQDKSAHPFTTSFHPTDVRITTRIAKNFFKTALFATIHETGHALYEQGMKPGDYGSPFGDAVSYGIHESQSRLWENFIGRSRAFWNHFYPILKNDFKRPLKGIEMEDFYKMVNTVEPSLVRVEADEVTYSLHIMLRFEIELMLINGDLPVKELPDLWNQKMEEYLGIRPTDYKDGVMQDVHWSAGYFGYFPTYALGNLYSAMIMEQARLDIPGLEDHIKNGKLLPLKEWLREKVHQKGRRVSAEELITGLTGKPLSARPYLDYLENKYNEIYKIKK